MLAILHVFKGWWKLGISKVIKYIIEWQCWIGGKEAGTSSQQIVDESEITDIKTICSSIDVKQRCLKPSYKINININSYW